MTNFENFIANTDSTANIVIRCNGFTHTTTPNNVSLNGDRVLFFDTLANIWVRTAQTKVNSFEIA
jgi:hypothetical protein